MTALQAVLSQITCAAKGNVAAQRAVIKAIQDCRFEPKFGDRQRNRTELTLLLRLLRRVPM